ncbi:hypothetical protein AAJCM20276_23840 [Acetobacter aceti]|uniref:Uncharacterized protein n=1 Tax=Acetobacter aceti TaxID=435 RepID=A0A6S6PL65_ACEAC|nr:hypothetical protein AAJCM20276_23840 [Acetobacter aceti]
MTVKRVNFNTIEAITKESSHNFTATRSRVEQRLDIVVLFIKTIKHRGSPLRDLSTMELWE